MPRAALSVAEVFRRYGDSFRAEVGAALSTAQRRVMTAIEQCRTAALGGHVEQCDHCGHRRVWYNSCRNRHCPTCQSLARAEWLERRRADLLPAEYFHVVFTVPPGRRPRSPPRTRPSSTACSSEPSPTRCAPSRPDPRHLGAEIGFFAVLHTWGQTLVHHPHLHCVIPGGGLANDGSGWVACRPGFFLPVRVLSRYFRRVLLAALEDAFESGQLHFAGRLQPLADPRRFAEHLRPARQTDWVVYAKRPFAGPEQVLDYLGRYTHRIAISNQRLRSLDDGAVAVSLHRLPQQRRRPPQDHDAGGDRVHPPHAAARAPARIPPHPLLRFPRQPRPAAEAGRVPAGALHAATSATAGRPGYGLSGSLRGADRPLVAPVSPLPRRPHATDRPPRRRLGVSGHSGFVVTGASTSASRASAPPGVSGTVDLRLRPSPRAARPPSRPSPADRRRAGNLPAPPGQSPPVPSACNATPIESHGGGQFRPIQLSVTGAVNALPPWAGRRRAANRKLLCITPTPSQRQPRFIFTPGPAVSLRLACSGPGRQGFDSCTNFGIVA